MPDPYTDEQLLIDEITGGQTLSELHATLTTIQALLSTLVERANQGQLPPAALLANEFLMGSDLDGGRGLGGSVYGRDFQIDPDDAGFPPNLFSIHQHPSWPQTPLPSMSWADYLATWHD